ncbi:MAG: aldo/keto reductase [Firmicutes bacterium]|nr:aldo/keto reductase [Bacillota bacterium]
MKSLTDCFTLYNGVKIPCVGFGTWQTPDGEVAEKSVLAAVEAGYRHIDTAAAYGNEESVGRAIKGCGVPREELFITTKLHNNCHGYNETMEAFKKSMKALGLDYLDLYLIHWPNPTRTREIWQEANAGTWKAFEELYEAGYIRSIGVSNFWPHHLDELYKTAKIGPMVNQIKLCPGLTQDMLVRYCRARGILLQAYSPLGTGSIMQVPEMQELAAKYGRTIAQICIRWSLQMGFNPLPKSVTPSRIFENTKVFDFELDPEDVKMIGALKWDLVPPRDPDYIPF